MPSDILLERIHRRMRELEGLARNMPTRVGRETLAIVGAVDALSGNSGADADNGGGVWRLEGGGRGV